MMLFSDFCWATGIEDTFIAHVRPGLRRMDEYELIQHYEFWRSDIDRIAETGVQAIRWGIPWYRVQPKPDEWDWRWTDEVLDYLVNVKGIEPIIDLVHYGTPLWLENSFLNAYYPERVADYAAEVAQRYKSLVRYYTPMNEPMINAGASGYSGVWPPYLVGRDGYVKVILAFSKGIVLTTQALKAEQPDCITVQVEALWHLYTRRPEYEERVYLHNERQFLAFDLATGRVGEGHSLYNYLRTYGVQDADLDWFRQQPAGFDYLGANFYPWSYGAARFNKAGGIYRVPVPVTGEVLGERLSEAYHRYGMPLVVTETSALGDPEARARWMDETIGAVRDLRQAGVPVMGYTWFPAFSMVDWAYRTGRRPLAHYLIHIGLWDCFFDQDGVLQRHVTPLVEHYRRHIERGMPPVSEPFEREAEQQA